MTLPTPNRVGPYRIEKSIGSGGMGAVFAAWDERLDRAVAIKRILPRQAGDERARRRFRREARAAAQLDHPAIVRVFDLVEGDEDWLIMELVEGERLSERMLDGLDLPTILDVARQIAGGLEAAHAAGIVHRDIKAENIAVVEDRAKILDFGLARAPGDESLTSDGALVGTRRAMSPEQVRGREVGPPSDLFSFGVLLYEMSSGRSPFEADSDFEVLRRIVTWEPTPLDSLCPDLPPALIDLVRDLLRKEAQRRPTAAQTVQRLRSLEAKVTQGSNNEASTTEPAATTRPLRAVVDGGSGEAHHDVGDRRTRGGWRSGAALFAAAITLAAIAAVAVWKYRSQPLVEPLVVAVPTPRLEASATHAARLLADAVRLGLLRSSTLVQVAAVSPEVVDPVAPAGAHSLSPEAVTRATAADEILVSRLDCGDLACDVRLERLSSDGLALWLEDFEVPLDEPRLGFQATVAALARAYPGRVSAHHVEKPSADDYRRFLELRRRFVAGPSADELSEIDAEVAEFITRGSPTVDMQLLAAHVAGRRFALGRDLEHHERAIRHAERAASAAPDDARPLALAVTLALEAGELDEAEQRLLALESAFPADLQVLAGRAWLASQRGDVEAALDTFATLAERRPSFFNYFRLARFEVKHGRLESARRHLDLALDAFPEHARSRSLLAHVEMMSGSVERAAEIYAELAAERPRMPVLSNLGFTQLLLGRFVGAARSFEQAVELAPQHAGLRLNLADALQLAGQPDLARSHYERTVELAVTDPASGGWQMQSIQAQALAHLGRSKEAVAAVHDVLRRAAENPQAHYEAALVYTLAGDRTSATVQAEAALASGLDRRWFGLPFFDDLELD